MTFFAFLREKYKIIKTPYCILVAKSTTGLQNQMKSTKKSSSTIFHSTILNFPFMISTPFRVMATYFTGGFHRPKTMFVAFLFFFV